jgi:hypothetical protein
MRTHLLPIGQINEHHQANWIGTLKNILILYGFFQDGLCIRRSTYGALHAFFKDHGKLLSLVDELLEQYQNRF